MVVCVTCGSEGYTFLLMLCHRCRLVAVHRYCVEGPCRIDGKDTTWICEDCIEDVKVTKPPLPNRKSERVSVVVEREAFRRQARKKRSRTLSILNTRQLNHGHIKDGCRNLYEQQRNVSFDAKNGRQDANMRLHEKSSDADRSTIRQGTKIVDEKKHIPPQGTISSRTTHQVHYDDEEKCLAKEANSKELASTKDVHSINFPRKRRLILQTDSYEEEIDNVSDESPKSALESASNSNEKIPSNVIAKNLSDKKHIRLHGNITSRIAQKEKYKSIIKIPERRRLTLEKDSYEEEIDYVSSPEFPKSDVEDANKYSNETISGNVPRQNLDGNIPMHTNLTKAYDRAWQPSSNALFKNNVQVQPMLDVIWRGSCIVQNLMGSVCLELGAHLSSMSIPIVHEVARALPLHFDFKVVPKYESWPQAFHKKPPSSNDIGLYFLPINESDEKIYERVLEKMNHDKLVLTSKINKTLDLLVLTSKELPLEQWRFQRKYYMWGVFKPAEAHSI